MSDELRAIERYRSLRPIAVGEWVDADDVAYDRDSRTELLEKVAGICLAEHPVDDAEPVTLEWFDGAVDSSEITMMGGTTIHQSEVFVEVMRWMPDMKTRGDVRRLCAAMGVELREP